MKAPVIVVPSLKVHGMALFPVILVSNDQARYDRVLIDHERIHLRQQAELLVLPFYVLYLLNYLVNRLRFKGHHEAYMNICFEREAYANERDATFLSHRKWYNWLRYL